MDAQQIQHFIAVDLLCNVVDFNTFIPITTVTLSFALSKGKWRVFIAGTLSEVHRGSTVVKVLCYKSEGR